MKEKVGGEGVRVGMVVGTGVALTALLRAELQIAAELFNLP